MKLFESGAVFGQDGRFGLGPGQTASRPNLVQVFGSFEPPVRFSFPASREVEFDLRLAKQRLEKRSKQALSWNETFQMIIEQSDLAKSKVLPNKPGNEQGFCAKCSRKKAVLKICEECSKKVDGAGLGQRNFKKLQNFLNFL
ncbi:hypothetical protein HZA40_02205 [Candidatus Peregrinibacteria bacterium]|nr:hypothetical protein [Candidatus Peregrinibacteria bacterium]